jgi:hypothetical protein
MASFWRDKIFGFGHMIGDGQVSACGSEVTDVLERKRKRTGYEAGE